MEITIQPKLNQLFSIQTDKIRWCQQFKSLYVLFQFCYQTNDFIVVRIKREINHIMRLTQTNLINGLIAKLKQNEYDRNSTYQFVLCSNARKTSLQHNRNDACKTGFLATSWYTLFNWQFQFRAKFVYNLEKQYVLHIPWY